jgi:hypothetical protein
MRWPPEFGAARSSSSRKALPQGGDPFSPCRRAMLGVSWSNDRAQPTMLPTPSRYSAYVIQTEEPNLSALDAVRLYKELTDVERAFANLKDVLDMRPI